MKDNFITTNSITSLLKMKPALREKKFNELTIEEQLSTVLFAPWEKRQEIITLSHRAREIVQALPAEELFWTIKATGPEDAALLLDYVRPSQLQLFFDLDWWHKAELRPDKIAAWLVLMFEHAGKKADAWLQWICQKDIWLMASILHKFVLVQKRPDDMEIQEAKDKLPAFTLDNVYYIAFRNPKLAPLMGMLLSKMIGLSAGFYRDALETMLGQTPSENLETAYKLRCGRIQDIGIPDYYESLDIYLPLEPGEMHRKEVEAFKSLPPSDHMPAFVPTLYISDLPMVHQAVIALAGSRDMERIVMESVGVANKVLMADSVNLDDPSALKSALKKTFSMLNLGMEFLGREWSLPPEKVLASCFIEEIVRVASHLLLGLSTMARGLDERRSSAFLPYELREQVRAALYRPSMLYNSAAADNEFITSLKQVDLCSSRLQQAESWCSITEMLNPAFDSWEKVIDWPATNFMAPEEFTAPAALGTAVCNRIIHGSMEVKPVSAQDCIRFINMIDENGKGIKDRAGSLIDEILSLVQSTGNCQADINNHEVVEIKELALKTVQRMFDELKETELDEGDPSDSLRFIKGLLVKTG